MIEHRIRVHALSLLVVLASAGAALPARAQDAGAWATFLRPYDYVQMIVEGDSVWCATAEAGVVLYHPSDATFQSITRAPGGLASNLLTSIATDLDGNLWIGTDDVGVSRLSPDRTTWGLLNAFDGLRSESVRCLTADPNRDSVWIGTDEGIALWNGREIAGTLPDGVNPSPFASDVITGIVVAGDSQFVATTAGVYLRRPAGGDAVIDTITRNLPVANVSALVTNGTDVLALAGNAVYRWSGALQAWLGTGAIGTVYRLRSSGGLAFACSSNGIFRWAGAWVLVDGSLRSNINPGGVFGVATAGANMDLYAASVAGMYTLPAAGGGAAFAVPQAPPGNNVLNLIIESPRVYVNTVVEGIGRWDGLQWRNWYPGGCGAGCDTTFLNPLVPFALLADKDGRKWFACWGIGMDVMDDTGPVPQFTRPTWNDGISFGQHTWGAAAALDSAGGHWFGMDTPNFGGTDPTDAPIGLEYYDSTGTYVANYQTPFNGMRGNGKIKALTVDRDGRVWVGHSGQGLQYFNWSRTSTSPSFSTVSGSENLDFRGLAASGDTIWASTTNDMRAYRHNAANITSLIGFYTIPAGPAQLALNPIAVGTNGRVWLGTTNGVRVYDRDGSTHVDYTTANSPLAGNEIRSIRVDPVTGAVWIGTANGINRFDPFYTPPPPPEVARLDVRVFPNPAMLTGVGTSIRLSGNATTYSGRIYDLTGRVLRRFSGAADRGVVWDGRDEDGAIARPGVYFLRVEAGGRETTARIVLLR